MSYDIHQLTRELHIKNNSKIVMLVADGLGGLPQEPGGKTELETAKTPNLDKLCQRGGLRLDRSLCCQGLLQAAGQVTWVFLDMIRLKYVMVAGHWKLLASALNSA